MKYLKIPDYIDIGDITKWMPILLSIMVSIGFGCWWLSEYKKRIVYEAYQKGYVDASVVYNKMFKNLTDEIEEKKESWKNQKEAYEKLIDTYEEYINIIQNKKNINEDDKETLILLKNDKEILERNRTA
jgi:esterase/lipase